MSGLRATVAALGAAVALCGAATASAHTGIAASAPAGGAVLERSPEQVVVRFAEALGDARDAEVRAGGRDLAGPARLDPGDRRRLIVPLEAAATGPHRVSWVVVAADGHPISGELSFTVRPAPLAGASQRIGREAVATARAVMDEVTTGR